MPLRENSATLHLANCMTAVYDWLLHNSLTLSPDKSEAAMFGTMQKVQSLQNLVSVSVARSQLTFVNHVKNLGITFDTRLSFK